MGLIGLALSTLTILSSLIKKSRAANLIFDWKLFWSVDIFIQIAGTLLTIAGFLICLHPALAKYPSWADNVLVILLVFATVGYLGSDVASRIFSVVNARINAAIDYKTNQADEANGTLGTPTPAGKPSSTKVPDSQ